ncbi:AzlD domain-containing protein [Alkalihalobacillus deserti]|uniref:AzlD domain-containing protein n=1 Tax=Alkalihalobacillus deserti TaxID=2879466 RepID=UPI00223D25DD|nr:AzlD domain-containing protein [Alkalihalobacillus deserti]
MNYSPQKVAIPVEYDHSFIIAGMALVTYIPRMLPLVFMDIEKVPEWVQAILRNVPYAALGALIFPGILTVHENSWYGMIGGIIAIVVAYLGANLIIVVVSSIVVLMLLSLLI